MSEEKKKKKLVGFALMKKLNPEKFKKVTDAARKKGGEAAQKTGKLHHFTSEEAKEMYKKMEEKGVLHRFTSETAREASKKGQEKKRQLAEERKKQKEQGDG